MADQMAGRMAGLALVDEIIQNAPAENSVSTYLQIFRNFQTSWSQSSDILKWEFDQLLDLQ